MQISWTTATASRQPKLSCLSSRSASVTRAISLSCRTWPSESVAFVSTVLTESDSWSGNSRMEAASGTIAGEFLGGSGAVAVDAGVAAGSAACGEGSGSAASGIGSGSTVSEASDGNSVRSNDDGMGTICGDSQLVSDVIGVASAAPEKGSEVAMWFIDPAQSIRCGFEL
jgi:hypothetical protein